MPYVIVLLVDIIGMSVHNTIEAVSEASFETKIELLCLFSTTAAQRCSVPTNTEMSRLN